MKDLKRILFAVRDFFGWGDSSETRLSPPHGWLLPVASELRTARAYAEWLRADSHKGQPTPHA